jgi:K+-transporting ATPase ATPase C chain
MKKNLITAILYTIASTVLLGIVYPLFVLGLAQLFPYQANGQLLTSNGVVIGSRIIGQQFSSLGYFHSRPSAAGNGYDPTNSSGSNLGPTNQRLIDRVNSDVTQLSQENPGMPVPIDLVTSSGSGLDPDISVASAEFQVPRIARARGTSEQQVRELVMEHITKRQWGFLGEPRLNVLELNLLLDQRYQKK